MAGYARTNTADIQSGTVVKSAPINAELNAIVTAFAFSGGHNHDGSSTEGAYVGLIADTDALNKVVVDTSNNRVGFFSEVSSAAVEQVRIQDGAILPVTDNDIDLGASGTEFKDLYIDGTAHIDTLDIDDNATVAGTLGVTGALTGSSTVQGTVITATTGFAPDASDGAYLGTSSLQFSDLFLADGAVINLGDDQDVTLTHVADTGVLLNSTSQLQFGDSGTYIYQSADGVLDLVSDTEIEINATTIDINGAADISGNLAVGGTLSLTGALTSNAGVVVDNITIDGTEIDLSSGDLTIDVAGDIILDADGGDVFFKDAGTTFGSATNSSGNLIIKSGTTTAVTFSGANASLAGTLTVAGASTLAATSFGDADITNVGDIALDSISADGTDINVAISDNSATAFTIKQGSDAYLIIDTANSSESVSIGTGISGTAITIGHSTSEVTVADNLTVTGNLTVNGTQTVVDTVTMNAQNAIVFEGATADAYETTLSIVDPTADHTQYLINQGGYIPVLAAATTTAITSTPAELNILDGVTSTTAELNILDGVNSTTAELNIVDGDTSATSTTVADADRVVMNDNGTMVQVAVTDLAAYFDDEITAMPNLVTTAATTVGALNSGSITSGFGSINNGSSAITTTGTVTYGSLSDGTITITAFVDEDDMSSDSATLVPTQQSVKAYVDDNRNVTGLNATGAEINTVADASAISIDTSTAVANNDAILMYDNSGTAMKYFDVDLLDTYYAGTTKTLTNKTLTAPKFADGGFIADANGNELIMLQTASSAVNQLEVTNSASGGAVVVGASGDDSNIDIDISPKGTGEVNIAAGNLNYAGTAITSTGAELNLLDGSSAGTVENSKAVIYGSSGEVNGTTLQIGGSSINSTAAELNLLDGSAKSTSSITIIDADGLVIIDGTTTKQIPASDIKTYVYGSISGDATTNSSGALTIANDAVESGMLNDNVISGQTELASGLADTDELMVSDGGTIKRMDMSVVKSYLTSAGFTTDDPTALAIALG